MSLLAFLGDAARSAVLLGLALAAMPLLRRAPASTRRLVLVLALASALLVPVASRLVPAWRVLPVAELPAANEPFAEPIGEAIVSPSAEPAAAAPAQAVPAPAAPAARPSSWGSALVTVWAPGVLAVLARLLVGLAQARAIAQRAAPISHRAITAALRESGTQARVRISREVDVPAVTGLFSSVVLVPREALGWTDARWRAVLLHELAHARQRDCLAQVVAQLACAMHWLNPLVWLAARRLRLERELSADERVLLAGTRPSEYAEHLLAIATGVPRLREIPGGALAMADRSQLLARVEAIVRPGTASLRTSTARALAITASMTALWGAVACVTAGGDGVPAASSPPASSPSASSPPVAPVAAGPMTEEVPPIPGVPADRVKSTIDQRIQAIVDEERQRLETEWHPSMVTVIVLNPKTGAVLAIADPSAAGSPRLSGSTMKSLMIAAALEEKAIAPSDRFFCDSGARAYGRLTLRDWAANEWLDVQQILTVSSNVGASRIFDKLGGAPLGRWLRRFHFDKPAGFGRLDAQTGAIPEPIEDGSFSGAEIAMGQRGAIASPLRMAAAYAAIANDGVYNAPFLTRPAFDLDGVVGFEHVPTNERLLRPETAGALMAMLERAVNDERATGKAARIEGVRVAGKTGTTDEKSAGGERRSYASFIGVAPADRPRLVVLVGAVTAAKNATGGRVAAPVFARIAARVLGR